MKPAPSLARFARRIVLPSGEHIHLYDSTVDQLGCGNQGHTAWPPIILIHGLQDESDTWHHIFEPLAERYRVIAPDLPGFGRSEKIRRNYTIEFFVWVVLGLMDALSIHSAIFIGNSLGAMLAEIIALKHPDRIRKLVMLAGTICWEQPVLSRVWNFITQDIHTHIQSYRLSLAQLRADTQGVWEILQSYYADLTTLPLADRDFLLKRLHERLQDEPQWFACLSVRQNLLVFFSAQMPALLTLLNQCQVPTLIVWGKQDRISSVSRALYRVRLQPSTRLLLLDNVGHLPQQENPKALLEVLWPFLE